MGNGSDYHRPVIAFKPQGWIAAFLAVYCASAAATTNTWSFPVSLALKESYDDNVWLQDSGPKRREGSLVTTFLPQAGVTWKRGADFDAAMNYAGTASFFHQEPSEDHMAHRGSMNWISSWKHVAIQSANSIVLINGDDESPIWTGPGGAPATGGPAIRDRRRAAIYRNSLRATIPVAGWFARPCATYYSHDWGTDLESTPGYQNYVDRNEWIIGGDAGWKGKETPAVFAGYRFGEQQQDKLLNFPEHYDSAFHRVLFGTEGALLPWLNAAVTLGPEWRRYDEGVASGFDDRSRVNLFVDATLTATPTAGDQITVSARQFQQPGFSGRSAYDDVTYDFEWRRALTSHWTVSSGTRAYNTRFLRPVRRNDWVLSPNLTVGYAAHSALLLECSCAYEIGFTKTDGADDRDYRRTLVSLGVKYSFR